MANFSSSTFHDSSSLNNGVQYQNNNIITTQAVNYPFENTLYLKYHSPDGYCKVTKNVDGNQFVGSSSGISKFGADIKIVISYNDIPRDTHPSVIACNISALFSNSSSGYEKPSFFAQQWSQGTDGWTLTLVLFMVTPSSTRTNGGYIYLDVIYRS